MTGDLDEEIRTVEARIAGERNRIARLLEDCGETARDAVATPKNLAAVAALGFVLGQLGRPRGDRPGRMRKRGLGGLLAGAAFALVRARYGSPWALARQFWAHAPRRTAPREAWRPSARAVNDSRTGPASDLSQRSAG